MEKELARKKAYLEKLKMEAWQRNKPSFFVKSERPQISL
jgi:hypothetical protein